MSSPRVPRTRTTSSTPRGRGIPVPASPARSTATTTSRPTRGLAPTPTLKTKTSAPKLRQPASTSRAKSPVSPASERPSSPASSQGGLSIKEQIALRRAEALKKAKSAKSSATFDEQSPIDIAVTPVEEDILGRWSIRDTIDRAKSSGSIALTARDLTRIPSYLFESHLGVTPEPLQDAPPEVVEPEAPSKIKKSGNTAWYEQVDLTTLKLWHNSIVELQPELSLFGSLKVLDLHKNQLKKLPDSFTDLIFLTYLDLSENELGTLPDGIASFPQLATLNVSHNKLEYIPFQVTASASSRSRNEGIFAPSTVERATVPLPALKILLASHNQFNTDSFQTAHIPRQLVEVDLSHNQLPGAGPLLSQLSTLNHLQKLRFHSCGLINTSLSTNPLKFPALKLMDLGENEELSEEAVRRALGERALEIGHEGQISTAGLHVVLGKPAPPREAWELEAENRVRLRKKSMTPAVSTSDDNPFKIGGDDVPSIRPPKPTTIVPPKAKVEAPVKEAWELEAEQGLLTEGGRRRARAAAAAAAAAKPTTPKKETVDLSSPTRSTPPISELNKLSLSSSTSTAPSLVQFYDGPHGTLTLPQSQPQARTHNRSFSVVPSAASANASDLVVPQQTMPLPTILSQSFANSIKVLVLSNRRMDSTFVLPASGLSSPLLPHLDELCLDNCNLSSQVTTTTEGASQAKEPLLELIAALFPSLGTLDLSYNMLTTTAGVGLLMIPDAEKKRKGLTTLRLRGNRLSSLDPLEELGNLWKNNEGISGWRGEEIDLRDNEIGRLPPLLGALPLEVLLVDGNTFRVPARRVWEKEGSKGLLKWLADRI
ncbi:hypothetical protein M408DRAFT_325938 [Serendipita vermifera MAFF 305830]|uniref:Leucine-rich repeat-containing protein 40 n=1 Tax=Serendipita vermifera MAFF 305830 TaxID=933852 RepID=A0A0C3BM61_SERVB|nr:hypothetical protein M408DRAFT_325938 [Serendipita vermifera MAFF 305830]